ncbi:MAG TPA: hypothetical protein VFN67_03750 [Polyangiales bacterium]|nr:hypothetical protein [Polyangiales bacterium]
MKALVWSLVGSLLTAACVLPHYDVVSSKRDRDAGTDSSSSSATSKDEKSAMIFADAPADCKSCMQDNCKEQRQSCGEHCKDLDWPVSPAWTVSDEADPFVRCLAEQCEEQCKVLWGCNKKYELAEPAADYSVTIRVTHAVRPNVKLEGLRVSACQGLDPSCQRGIGQVSSQVTNADSEAVLLLPKSFLGYFLVEPMNTDEPDPYLPMTVVWSQPLYRHEQVLTVSMFNRSLVPALASTVEKVQSGKGNFIFKAQNCLPERYVGEGGANAEAEDEVVNYYSPNGEGSRVYYTRNGLIIDLNAHETHADGGSFGGAFNLAAGSVSVTGTHKAMEVSSAGFPLRADSLGIVFLLPKAQ